MVKSKSAVNFKTVFSRPGWWLCLGLALLVFIELVWLTVTQYLAFNNASIDISNMSQAIWSVTRGQPLVFTMEGAPISRLALHVELFYLALAPVYALWPSPVSLLVVQALLFVTGVIPVYKLAERHLQHSAAIVACVIIYLFYPVAQTAVLFDFHGDTLAMPFLLWALEAMDRQAWRSYFIWLVLALMCKFYVAIVVVAIGGILWLKGERRIAIGTIGLGVLWGGIAFFGVRPLFANADVTDVQATPGSYISYYFGELAQLASSVLPRFLVGLIVYLPALFLGWRVPVWLLASALISVPVLLSSGPGPAYHYTYHHYALAVPFLIVSIIYGAKKLRLKQDKRVKGLPWIVVLGITLIATVGLNSLFVDSPLNMRFYRPVEGSGQGLDIARYKITPRDKMKSEWLTANVPQQASVASNALIVPHIINHHTVYVTGNLTINQLKSLAEILDEVDYVIVDSLFDYVIGDLEEITLGGVAYDHGVLSALLQHPNFGLQKAQDGLLLFSKTGDSLAQSAIAYSAEEPLSPQAEFDGKIALIQAEITPSGQTEMEQNRYQLYVEWMALTDLSNTAPLFAVSHISGLENARIAHLPTIGILPATSWQTDQIVQETFEFTLPPDTPPGIYPVYVGWYDSQNLFAAETDSRSQVGESVLLGEIVVP